MKRHGMLMAMASTLLACGGASLGPDRGAVQLGAHGAELATEAAVSTVRLRVYGATGNPWAGVELAAARDASGRWSARVDRVPVGDVAFHATALDGTGQVVYESVSPDPVRRVVAGGTIDMTLVLQRKGGATPYANGAPFISSADVSRTQLGAGGVAHLAAAYDDLDGPSDIASARWSGPGTFASPDAAETDWTAPSTDGDYVLRFTVTDRKGQAAIVEVTMHVDRAFARGAVAIDFAFNASPVVQRIRVQDVKALGGAPAQDVIELGAEATDADGDFLGYAWVEANGCSGAFTGPRDAATTRFTADPGGVDCRFVVTVRDYSAADHAVARGGVNTGTVSVAMSPPVVELP